MPYSGTNLTPFPTAWKHPTIGGTSCAHSVGNPYGTDDIDNNLVLDSSVLYNGLPTIRIDPATAFNAARECDGPWIAVTPGDHIVFKAWLKISASSLGDTAYYDGIRLGIDFYGPNGDINGTCCLDGAVWTPEGGYPSDPQSNIVWGTNGWVLVTIDFIVPSQVPGGPAVFGYAYSPGQMVTPQHIVPWMQVVNVTDQGQGWFASTELYINPSGSPDGDYYSVGVTTSGGGGYTSPIGSFQVEVGTNFQVEAIPDTNYDFVKWLRNSVQVSTNTVYTITDGVADEEYVMEAYFTYNPPPTEGGSVVAPSIALVFGAVAPPQTDVIEMLVHLGCTKEVSSFEVRLQNWDGKYSPGGTYPILVGTDGAIYLGRGATCPLLITCHVEGIAYKTTPDEHYITVTGRCWGERLFRYAVTQAYATQKGEAIVKNIIDYHAGISHVRGGVELIEDTDTTYTSLDYTESPAWDILKYVAQSADKSGVIGYDFRVAPDGKFEFFPLLSKTNSTVLVEQIDDSSNYRKDISRVRNRIRIYGIADKSVPLDKVTWTRSLTPADGAWAAGAGVISLDATGAPDGGACIKLSVPGSLYWGSAVFTLVAGSAVNTELYPLLDVQFKLDATYSGTGTLVLWDAASKAVTKSVSVSPDAAWHTFEVGVGSAYVNQWESIQPGFDWTQIRVVLLYFYFPQNVGSGNFRVHQLYFGGRRYYAMEENVASQSAYGIRELVETDEELWTDNECDLRAKALLNYLSLPAEYLTLISTVIDYGSTPIQAGDKVHVHLPNEYVDSDFRVDEVEYHVMNDAQVLETKLELGKTPPQLADYLYGSRTFTVNVEKLSRTKLGRRGVPITTSGGAGAGSYFNSNVEVDKDSPVVNLLTGRVLKACIGFDGANFFVVSYTGDLILRSASTIIRPYANGSDDLGSPSFRFNHVYVNDVDTLNTKTGDIYPAGGVNTGHCGDTSVYWACIAGDSVWYNALGHMDFMDDLAIIKGLKMSKKVDKLGIPLIDNKSLPEAIRSKSGLIHGGHLLGLALGAIKQLNAKVDELSRKLEAYESRHKVSG